jgi:hypothetical protein
MPAKAAADKAKPTIPYKIVTDENGVEYKLHGFGAGNLRKLDIDPRIDLTKPIWEQVQRLARKDQREAKRSKTSRAA